VRKAIVIVAGVFLISFALQEFLHRQFPHRSLEWIPLVFAALALRVSTRLVSRRRREQAALKHITPIRLKA
jgi:ABC-type transport system involved in cytochrome bd biosynthesis fused ATPase/permease subunit